METDNKPLILLIIAAIFYILISLNVFFWVALLVSLFAFFPVMFIIIKLDQKKVYKNEQPIRDAHKKLGYPELTREQQLSTLLHYHNLGTDYVNKLIDSYHTPYYIYKHYINTTPEELLNYITSNKEQFGITEDINNHSGFFYIKTRNGKLQLMMHDKGGPFKIKTLSSEENLCRYIVYNIYENYKLLKKFGLTKKYYKTSP